MAASQTKNRSKTTTPRPRGTFRIGHRQRAPLSTRRGWAIAALVHVLLALILGNALTFGRGALSEFFDFRREPMSEERITYIDRVEERVPEPQPATRQQTPPPPRPRAAENTGPVPGSGGLPTSPPVTASDTAYGAAAAASSVVGNPVTELRGVQPTYTDGRIWGSASPLVGIPRTGAERLDSIISYAIVTAADSLNAIALRNGEGGRRPGDWTVRGENGDKWGWDHVGIRLGKITIPNALLTLLPMNAQVAMSGNYTEMERERRLGLARADIQRMSSRGIGEAQFRMLVKELRERREREYQEKVKALNATRVARDKDKN